MTDHPMMTRRTALTAAVLVTAGRAMATEESTIGSEQAIARNKANLRRYYDDIFNKQDLSNAHEYISPEFHSSGTDAIDGDRPEAGYVAFFERIFAMFERKWKDIKIDLWAITAEGNRATTAYTGTGLFYPGPDGRAEPDAVGVPLTLNGMALYEFDEDGRILKIHSLEDSGPIVRAEMEYAQKRQPDLESRNKEVAKRFYAEFISAQDISKAAEFLSPSFRFHDSDGEGAQDPVEHFRGLFQLIKAQSLEFILTPDEMIAEGNTVAVRWHETALLRPNETGMAERLNWTGMSVLEFDQKGLIMRADVVKVQGETTEETVEDQQ